MKLTQHLWFEKDMEAAVRFYTSLIPGSLSALSGGSKWAARRMCVPMNGVESVGPEKRAIARVGACIADNLACIVDSSGRTESR